MFKGTITSPELLRGDDKHRKLMNDKIRFMRGHRKFMNDKIRFMRGEEGENIHGNSK